MPGLPASVSASKGWIFPAGSVRAIDSIVPLAGFARCPLRVRKVLRKPNSTKSDLCLPISNLRGLSQRAWRIVSGSCRIVSDHRGARSCETRGEVSKITERSQKSRRLKLIGPSGSAPCATVPAKMMPPASPSGVDLENGAKYDGGKGKRTNGLGSAVGSKKSKKKWWRRNRIWVVVLVFIFTSAAMWMCVSRRGAHACHLSRPKLSLPVAFGRQDC